MKDYLNKLNNYLQLHLYKYYNPYISQNEQELLERAANIDVYDNEEKYPLEYTTYTINQPSDPGRIGAGVIPLESIVCILTEELAGESFPDVLDDIGEFLDGLYHPFHFVMRVLKRRSIIEIILLDLLNE